MFIVRRIFTLKSSYSLSDAMLVDKIHPYTCVYIFEMLEFVVMSKTFSLEG